MHPHASRLRHRADEGAGAAFPVGAGDMDDGWQVPFG